MAVHTAFAAVTRCTSPRYAQHITADVCAAGAQSGEIARARADRTHRETARRIINSLLFAFAPVVGVIAPILALVANLRGGGKIEQSDVSMASALVAAAKSFSW